MPKCSVTTYSDKYKDEFEWVERDPKCSTNALCKLCNGKINISSMGRTALVSHAKGAKHTFAAANKARSLPMDVFVKKKNDLKPTSSVVTLTPSLDLPCSSSVVPALKTFLVNEETSKAEILWCLASVMFHLSFRSAAGLASLLPIMFADSTIASKLQIQRTKLAYTVVHGIAPYFTEKPKNKLNSCPHVVLAFDESFNKISQRQQMDIHVKFWDDDNNEVTSRYFTSAFLNKACASDLLGAIQELVPPQLLEKTIQISMDGPNVNLKVVKDLEYVLHEGNVDVPYFLQLGTCGLHTVHNAFKTGVTSTGWKLVQFLRALYNLFKNSPSRRGDFISYTNSSRFPHKFCSVRWVENAKVASRAQAMLPDLLLYTSNVTKQKKVPDCESYRIVSEFLNDKLLGPKLAFFSAMAAEVEPFLKEFQNEAPMAPFLYSALHLMVKSVMERFVKGDIIENKDITKIDLTLSDNLIFAKNVDLGFSTKDALKNSKLHVKEVDILHFKHDCVKFYKSFVQKILSKSPLSFRLSKNVSCLDPAVICASPTLAQHRMQKLLEALVEKRWMAGLLADKIKSEFRELCKLPYLLESVKSYRRNEVRLDKFWMQVVDVDKLSPNLTLLVKMMLIMSHGNASVERGFSVNAECLVENQHEESLIALRQVYDSVSILGGIGKVLIDKSLIHSCRNAHAKYVELSEIKRKQKHEESVAIQEKKMKALEIKELEAKKAKLLADAAKAAALIEDEISMKRK